MLILHFAIFLILVASTSSQKNLLPPGHLSYYVPFKERQVVLTELPLRVPYTVVVPTAAISYTSVSHIPTVPLYGPLAYSGYQYVPQQTTLGRKKRSFYSY